MINGNNVRIIPEVDRNGIQTAFNTTPVTSILSMDELQLSANGKHRLVKLLARKKIKNLADFILFTDDFVAVGNDTHKTKLARMRDSGPAVMKCAQQVRNYLCNNDMVTDPYKNARSTEIKSTRTTDTTHRVQMNNLRAVNNILRTKLEHSTRMNAILEDALKSRGVTV